MIFITLCWGLVVMDFLLGSGKGPFVIQSWFMVKLLNYG